MLYVEHNCLGQKSFKQVISRKYINKQAIHCWFPAWTVQQQGDWPNNFANAPHNSFKDCWADEASITLWTSAIVPVESKFEACLSFNHHSWGYSGEKLSTAKSLKSITLGQVWAVLRLRVTLCRSTKLKTVGWASILSQIWGIAAVSNLKKECCHSLQWISLIFKKI